MMKIPVFDIKRQNRIIGKEILEAIKKTVEGGQYVLGPKVGEFEREFARYLGVKYAIGVACGTDAITLALMAFGIGDGDEVIIPANAYPTAFAVTAVGAIPKLVDIDPVTYNIDPRQIPAAITNKTKAVIVVHMYGQPAEILSMYRNIDKNGKEIPVIEDCAQAVGATLSVAIPPLSGGAEVKMHECIKNNPPYPPLNLRGGIRQQAEGELCWRKVGSIGDAGCFSFYPTKNLACFGDGGMVVTNNKELAERVRKLRMYGEESRYHSVILGRNSRLDELQAAVLLVKLKYLDSWNERRREIAEIYLRHLSPPATHALALRAGNLGHLSKKIKHVYHLFVIRTKRRDKLKSYLEKKGIGTGIHYPVPVHLVPSFKFLGYKKGDFPQSEKACREILSLPMYPELKDEEVGKVAGEISKWIKEEKRISL